MDRSLNLARLVGALAGRTGLPTAEELQRRMADAEVQLVLRSPELDQDVVDTGWYLHAVASIDRARERYTYARQRQAFQVSAHIFDLALDQGVELPRAERLSYGFAAAIGYRRGGREPNATAIMHRLRDAIDPAGPVADHLATLPLEVGLAFLGFETRTLFTWLREWRRQLNALAADSDLPDLTGTIFGPVHLLVLGAHDLLQYFAHGSRDALGRGVERLRTVAAGRAGDDLNARWVAYHLLALSGEAEQGSLWNPEVMPPGVPDLVRQAFTVGSPPVLTLWEPQRDLLIGGRSPFSPDERRMVLAVPTSGGKTLLAQLLAVEELARTDRSVCYVAPSRSLCREVRRAMAARVRVLQKEPGHEQPDFPSWLGLDPFFAEPADVEVITPERLAHLLRHDADAVLDRFGLFIFDEAQLLKETGRGFILETVIALLNHLSANRDHRIVLISAAMGNAGAIAQWLDPAGGALRHESQWRGPRRLHAAFTTKAQWSNTRAERRPRARKWIYHLVTPLAGRLRLRLADGRHYDLVTTKPTGWQKFRFSDHPRLPQWDIPTDKESSTRQYRIAAGMITRLGHAGAVLAVASTRAQAQQLATGLAEILQEHPPALPLADFVRLQLGDDHPLSGMLRKGVGFHHAGLPNDVLEALEEAVRDDILPYLTCTSTLTDGINLPVRTVVIYDQAQGVPDQAQMRGARLVNAMGRAGRAGKETEGWIVLVRGAAPTDQDFTDLNPGADDLAITSSLATAEALDSFAELEVALRGDQDALFSASGPARDFIGFVWLALAVEEERHQDVAALDLERIIDATLAAQSAPARAACISLASATRAAYLRIDPSSRRRWSRTGTSIGSARILDALAGELAAQITTGHHDGSGVDLTGPLAAIQIPSLLPRLLNLEEAPAWRFRLTRSGADIHVDPARLLLRWLEGRSLPDLAQEFLPQVTDKAWRIEQIVDICSKHFEHYLSWTLGALSELVNIRLSEMNPGSSFDAWLCPDLGSYVRYGVHDPRALIMMASGIRSRRLVHTVLADLPPDLEVALDALRQWIAVRGIPGWRSIYNASASEILDLLDFTRVRNRSLLETGTATIDLLDQDIVPPASNGLLTLEPQRGVPTPAPLAVYADDRFVATIPAQDQADLSVALDSGLEITLTIQPGTPHTTLVLTRSRSHDN